MRGIIHGPGLLRRVWRKKFQLEHCYCALDPSKLIEGPDATEDASDLSLGSSTNKIVPRRNEQPWHMILPLPNCCLHELILNLPPAYGDVRWKVIFCTENDGFSLPRLYRQLEHYDGAAMLIIEGSSLIEGYESFSIFGAFLSELPARHHAGLAYFGSRETFVFRYLEAATDIQGRSGLECFHWCDSENPSDCRVSRNTRFIQAAPEHLSIGDGAFGPAIRFGVDLQHGTTSRCCETFAGCNELVGKSEMGLMHSEFHVSRLCVISLETELVRLTTVSPRHHRQFCELTSSEVQSTLNIDEVSTEPTAESCSLHPESNLRDARSLLDPFIVHSCGCRSDVRHQCTFLHDALHRVALE